MKVQPAKFLRTTLPLDVAAVDDWDVGGRYHSVWLPDHMVSFWPDSIWTAEFTDLAEVSPSPHRYLDTLVVAGAVAALSRNVPIATCVTDTVRRHPSTLAQAALTLGHVSKGRFILGLGSGEAENAVPYGIDFTRTVSRFEEAITVIRLLWERQGLVDFEGEFFRLERARLDTEPYGGRVPPVWIGANGPRMLEITGRLADGWWPTQVWSPHEYSAKLGVVRAAAERAGRDPDAIVPAATMGLLIGEEDEVVEMLQAPLLKAWLLQVPATVLRARGFEHPMGQHWGGYHEINPGDLTRDRIVEMLARVDTGVLLELFRHGTPQQTARIVKDYCDAGLRVPAIIDYSRMAGQGYAAQSAAKIRQVEDELLRLCEVSA